MEQILLDALLSIDGYKLVTAFSEFATGAGIVIGAWWTYRRFIQGREKETALSIDVTYTTDQYLGDHWLTFISIVLKNQGKVAVRAKESMHPAYDKLKTDGKDHYYSYGCSLKIREVPATLSPNTHLDWFGELAPPGWPNQTLEFNVLSGYIDKALSTGSVETDFWMEPGESYSLAVPVILKRGTYLGLVTFIGTHESEYWQRVVLLKIPSQVLVVQTRGDNLGGPKIELSPSTP